MDVLAALVFYSAMKTTGKICRVARVSLPSRSFHFVLSWFLTLAFLTGFSCASLWRATTSLSHSLSFLIGFLFTVVGCFLSSTTSSDCVLKNMDAENDLIKALGIADIGNESPEAINEEEEGEEVQMESSYEVVPDPNADAVDLSQLRGATSGDADSPKKVDPDAGSDKDLENLAELVPDVKSRRRASSDDAGFQPDGEDLLAEERDVVGDGIEVTADAAARAKQQRKMSMQSADSTNARRLSIQSVSEFINRNESLKAQESREVDDSSKQAATPGDKAYQAEDEASSDNAQSEDDSFDNYGGSDTGVDASAGNEDVPGDEKVPKEFLNTMGSGQSISTATQTHEVRMPMYLPTFKPATGCTNASDFIVRCFVARLRAGITVVKHGRSRWCKSRLRILHIHPDGRSLSWKPAEGEPASSRRPPKLDLSTCLEVRHAWSPDPQNPMYTGTQILRQKCEAANAHKSFALIFKTRTVDITAVTADQCKVLMEGFSALCFRLQVANLAGRGQKKGHARPMPEEDGVSTTASNTLTNTSTPRAAR